MHVHIEALRMGEQLRHLGAAGDAAPEELGAVAQLHDVGTEEIDGMRALKATHCLVDVDTGDGHDVLDDQPEADPVTRADDQVARCRQDLRGAPPPGR